MRIIHVEAALGFRVLGSYLIGAPRSLLLLLLLLLLLSLLDAFPTVSSGVFRRVRLTALGTRVVLSLKVLAGRRRVTRVRVHGDCSNAIPLIKIEPLIYLRNGNPPGKFYRAASLGVLPIALISLRSRE